MSSYIPATPPRSHRKHKRTSSIPYATPKTPFSRHQDFSLDYKISTKTNLLKTPSSNKEFSVYQTPITPKSTTKKNKNDMVLSSPHGTQNLEVLPFNSRSLFPPNPSRIGTGRSHHKQNLKAPSLTTLLTLAALSSSSELELSDPEMEPKTPRRQIISGPRVAPRLPCKDDDGDDDLLPESSTRKQVNPFVDQKEEIKKELVYVDKYGRKKTEQLSDEEASLLQKTRRKLSFN